MTAEQLLADIRALERFAAAGGAADALLARAISRLTLVCMGVPIARLDGFLRAQQLIERGLAVRTACASAGLSRGHFYALRKRVSGVRGHTGDNVTIASALRAWR